MKIRHFYIKLYLKDRLDIEFTAFQGELMPEEALTSFNARMGKVRPAGRMRLPDSFCAARRQQQKRFNVRPFKKS